MANKKVKIELTGQCFELCIGILSNNEKSKFQDYCRRTLLSTQKVWYGRSDVMKSSWGLKTGGESINWIMLSGFYFPVERKLKDSLNI